MASYLGDIFAQQFGSMDIEIWAEPFAGGAGAGLALLDAGIVQEVWLTEKHPPLAAFWRTVCNDGPALAERIARTPATLETWEGSRELLAAHQRGEAFNDFDLGFAAFLVNRCSRSGIMTPSAGPIGGKQQRGRWTIASRYNPSALAARIRHIHSMASNIRINEGDAMSTIAELTDSGIEDELMLFVDPPYICEGNRLYVNGFTEGDHRQLADNLKACPTRWVLTYDDEPVVANDLYANYRVLSYSIAHTANNQCVAREFAVFADNLRVDLSAVPLPRGDAHWLPDIRSQAAQTLGI